MQTEYPRRSWPASHGHASVRQHISLAGVWLSYYGSLPPTLKLLLQLTDNLDPQLDDSFHFATENSSYL